MSTHPVRARGTFAAISLLLAGLAPAADLATTALLQPVSGCDLTSTQAVTVRVFNFGVPLPAATSFTLSYAIDGGAPVVEVVTLASAFPANTSRDFSFTTPADLAVPGSYVFDASVAIPGDTFPSNDASVGNIVVNASPVGGTVSGPSSAASGTLSLSGQSGTIVQWEESPDGLRWFKLANTTASQSFSGLVAPTRFRVRVAAGGCLPAVSDEFIVEP